MYSLTTQELNEFYAAHGFVWRAEIGATIAIAATGVYHVGVAIGDIPLRILSRSYSSSESPLTVELFEASFTLGANARTLNKNLSGNQTPPAQFVSGVTPGTLGAVITSAILRAPTAGGTSQVTLSADNNVLITKRNTSYVIRFTNGGGANAIIGAALDYRTIQPED